MDDSSQDMSETHIAVFKQYLQWDRVRGTENLHCPGHCKTMAMHMNKTDGEKNPKS